MRPQVQDCTLLPARSAKDIKHELRK